MAKTRRLTGKRRLAGKAIEDRIRHVGVRLHGQGGHLSPGGKQYPYCENETALRWRNEWTWKNRIVSKKPKLSRPVESILPNGGPWPGSALCRPPRMSPRHCFRCIRMRRAIRRPVVSALPPDWSLSRVGRIRRGRKSGAGGTLSCGLRPDPFALRHWQSAYETDRRGG